MPATVATRALGMVPLGAVVGGGAEYLRGGDRTQIERAALTGAAGGALAAAHQRELAEAGKLTGRALARSLGGTAVGSLVLPSYYALKGFPQKMRDAEKRHEEALARSAQRGVQDLPPKRNDPEWKRWIGEQVRRDMEFEASDPNYRVKQAAAPMSYGRLLAQNLPVAGTLGGISGHTAGPEGREREAAAFGTAGALAGQSALDKLRKQTVNKLIAEGANPAIVAELLESPQRASRAAYGVPRPGETIGASFGRQVRKVFGKMVDRPTWKRLSRGSLFASLSIPVALGSGLLAAQGARLLPEKEES